MEEILRLFLKSRRTELSENSKKAYNSKLKKIIGKMGLKNPKDITRDRLVNYIDGLLKEKQKSATISNKLHIFRSFCNWLWTEDYIKEKEYKKISSYKPNLEKGDGDVREALSPKEERLCLKKLDNPMLRTLFFTGVNYGLRRQEYRNLKIEDVDLNKKILTIRVSKGNKTRQIPILDDHVKIWKNWLNTREILKPEHNYVFFTSRGQCSVESVHKMFKLIFNMAFGDNGTKKISSHTLRYTYATKLWRGGMDLYVISKMLGHESIKTTETYLRVEKQELFARYIQEASNIL